MDSISGLSLSVPMEEERQREQARQRRALRRDSFRQVPELARLHTDTTELEQTFREKVQQLAERLADDLAMAWQKEAARIHNQPLNGAERNKLLYLAGDVVLKYLPTSGFIYRMCEDETE